MEVDDVTFMCTWNLSQYHIMMISILVYLSYAIFMSYNTKNILGFSYAIFMSYNMNNILGIYQSDYS
jgi:hypothetical protein